MSISIRRSRVRMRSSSSASVIPSGNVSFKSSNVRYPCSFASLISSRMRLWISIVECSRATPSRRGFGEAAPLRHCPRACAMRLGLDVAIPRCLFRLRRRVDDLVAKRRRTRLLFSRGDDFRLLSFRFECLTKVAVKDLAETQSLPWVDRLAVDPAGRRKLRKLAELFQEVKNFFLQIHLLASAELRKPDSVLRQIELAAQDPLANAEPPFFHHRFGVGRHFL